jgi:hypothetical protein
MDSLVVGVSNIVVLPDIAHIAYHNRLHAISGNDFYSCESVEIAHLNNPLTNPLPNCSFWPQKPPQHTSAPASGGHSLVLLPTRTRA